MGRGPPAGGVVAGAALGRRRLSILCSDAEEGVERIIFWRLFLVQLSERTVWKEPAMASSSMHA